MGFNSGFKGLNASGRVLYVMRQTDRRDNLAKTEARR